MMQLEHEPCSLALQLEQQLVPRPQLQLMPMLEPKPLPGLEFGLGPGFEL